MRIGDRVLSLTSFGTHYAALMLWILSDLLRRIATGDAWSIASAVVILATMVFFGLVRVKHPEPYIWTADQTDRLHAAVGKTIRVRCTAWEPGTSFTPRSYAVDVTDRLVAVSMTERAGVQLTFALSTVRCRTITDLEVIPVSATGHA